MEGIRIQPSKILIRLGGIHQGPPAYRGEGALENRTSIVILIGILLLNPDRRGRGSANLDFARTSLMDAPLIVS